MLEREPEDPTAGCATWSLKTPLLFKLRSSAHYRAQSVHVRTPRPSSCLLSWMLCLIYVAAPEHFTTIPPATGGAAPQVRRDGQEGEGADVCNRQGPLEGACARRWGKVEEE